MSLSCTKHLVHGLYHIVIPFKSRYIEQNRKWTRPRIGKDGLSTPYNRMKTIWAKVFYAARSSTGKCRFYYTNDGATVRILCPRKGDQTITMDQLLHWAAFIMSEFDHRLDAMLPESFALPSEPNDIFDNSAISSSFLDSAECRTRLDPIFHKIKLALFADNEKRHCLFRNGILNKKSVKEYLEKDQSFLAIFAIMFEWLCGNPARSAQAVDLRYRPYGSDMRNMFLIAGALIVGWPKSKVKRGAFHLQASLWVFPKAKRWRIIFYFGVIREIVVTIVEKMGGSARLLRTHLFVDSLVAAESTEVQPPDDNTVRKILWNGTKFNNRLRSVGPPELNIDDKFLRQLFASLSGKQIPQLTNLHIRNPLANATHPLLNEDRNMAQSHFQTTFNMSRAIVGGCFAVSQTWQALWGVGLMDKSWKAIFFDQPSCIVDENQVIAMQRARRLVLANYLLDCPTTDARKDAVTNALHNLIFLHGNNSSMVR